MNKMLKIMDYTLEVKDDKVFYGGFLDLEGTGITSLPDNLTVGGSLYLEGTGITSLPDNLTVGGTLYLRGTGITSLPDNLTVGGSLDLEGTGITDTSKVKKGLDSESIRKIEAVKYPTIFWEVNGRRYIKVDGVFSVIVSQKGNVYRTRQIGKTDMGYLITDGAGTYAHGKTLREARTDLLFKLHDRDTSDYEGLNIDSVLSFEEAIVCYRVITGACNFGTTEYIKKRLPKPHKEEYSIGEIIELTRDEYGGGIFSGFFCK